MNVHTIQKRIQESVSVKPVKYLNHVHHLIGQNVDQKADVPELHELLFLQVQKLPV